MRTIFVSIMCFLCVLSVSSADVLDKVRESGTFTVGYRTDAPPFSYESNSGQPKGLAVSLCQDVSTALKAELGLDEIKIDYVPVTARTRFERLQSGAIDILCGPTTQTISRRQDMDFSIPYFIDGSSVVFRAGEGESVEDLKGRAVGLLEGTTTAKIVRDLLADRKVDAEVITYDTHINGLMALADGNIAAYFGDQAILRYQLGRMRPRTPLKFLAEQYSFEPYALAVKREETRLRLVVDSALSQTFTNGDIYEHIAMALGEVTLSDLALAVYQIVALPD
ncbi:MAG: amino acid ABC transporter substrate-binding protein [Pikeienuella sp.]